MNDTTKQQLEVIGLLPAGGQATRIAPLPGSKEVYPIGFRVIEDGSLRPKVVCHYLLEKMRLAGVHKAYIILREGKWDIPAYLGNGSMLDMHLTYLMLGLPFGAPYTLDQAYPFVQDALVAIGFPDVLFQPDDAFVHLLARQAITQAEVVLGLFPSDQPIKPPHTDLRYTWMIAVWTPVFTRFMHDHLAETVASATRQPELFVGDVIQAAIRQGLPIQSVLFPNGQCLDVGLPENLVKASRNLLPPTA
ncbi:MAG: dTDP-glucose pyrophosphorylase [Chloroflexi bacterium]|nr:dTDP-glucose pyrophosphorylase [Chloroflexota bacterium]